VCSSDLFGRFGRSKAKESEEELPPAKTAEVEKEKKPESDVGGKRDRSKKESTDRKSVVEGKSVNLGGSRMSRKKE